MVFSWHRVKIRIDYSFLLMTAFAVLSEQQRLLYVLLFASLHEAGHLTALLIMKGTLREINLAFYGIGIRFRAAFSLRQELLFLLSGVAVNLFFFLAGIQREVNLALFIINILPVYPLDGGRALALFMPYRYCRMLGMAILVLVLIYALLSFNFSALMIALYIIVFSVKEDLR